MDPSQMSVENVKEIILKFPDEDKMMLLRELEKDMFPKRLDMLLRDLKDVPLSYEEIKEEVEYVRKRRYKR
jgi:porphobilinogen deaminase